MSFLSVQNVCEPRTRRLQESYVIKFKAMLCLFSAVLSRRHPPSPSPQVVPLWTIPPMNLFKRGHKGPHAPPPPSWTAVNKQVANLRLKDLPVLFCYVYMLLQANIVFVLKHICHIKYKGEKDTLVGLQCLGRLHPAGCQRKICLFRIRSKSSAMNRNYAFQVG